MFQHTATRRWLLPDESDKLLSMVVSTHSHPKVAAIRLHHLKPYPLVSTHSHPKVAASYSDLIIWQYRGFQHTATRRWLQAMMKSEECGYMSFNTQPPEGGCTVRIVDLQLFELFQHTATRRWLPSYTICTNNINQSFNTQPPEGGCSLHKKARKISKLNTVFR